MNSADPLEDKKAKARKISIKEGSAYSVMEGFGLRNITPYALAMGAKNTHIGFLSSIPQLLGHLSQLFTLKLMQENSRKKIVIFAVLLQALLWLPLIGVGAYYFLFHGSSQVAALLLIFVYTLLIVAGLSLGPAWNSWMKDIMSATPGSYFGMRNRITGFVALVSMLIAGFILDALKKTHLFLGFAIIFGIAFLFRLISASLFLKKHEPELKYEPAFYFSLLDFLKRMRSNNFGKFTIYVSFLMFATAIASPFFAVYMLKELHFNYVTYTAISIFSSLFSLLFMPAWGKFADRYGNIRIMKICGYLVPFVPLLWLLSVFLVHSPLLLVLY